MKPLASTLLALLLTFILAVPGVVAQDVAQEIDQLMQQYYDVGQFNGTVLVARNGEVIFEKGYGWANMEWDLPNTPDTKFRIGSITKQFTAAVILQLAAEGKIDLQAPLSKYLPDYPAKGAHVTVHQLLTHTSGIPSYTSLPNFFAELSRDPYTTEEVMALFSEMDLEFAPGSQWVYNNSGYFILGAIIEKVTGESYEDVLEARIFAPAGMDDTGYDHAATILEKRASGYERAGTGYRNAPYLDMSLPYAAGSLYSTTRDLYKWDRALDAHTLLSPAMTALMEEGHMDTPLGGAYGYGVVVAERTLDSAGKTVRTVEHGGGINGFNTHLVRVPEEDHVIVLFNNTGGTNLQGMARGIGEILYGGAAEAPIPFISQVLAATIEEQGVEAALAQYHRLKKDDPAGYVFEEQELNRLGYALMGDGQLEAALEIFKLNVAAFPEAFNTYDSLGEAYMEAGQTEKAIANYEKSLELNPRNENAKEMLAKMGVEVAEDLGAELDLPADLLERYVGRYELQPTFILTITRDGTQLSAQATGQPRIEIYPESETRFFLKVVDAQIAFDVTEGGDVTGLTLYQGGQVLPAPKIE